MNTTVLRIAVCAALAALTTGQAFAQAVAPGITTQPLSQLVTAGATTTFTVAATGTAPLQYQWLKDGDEINRATTATLTITNVRLNDAGIYTVKVSNAAGNVTSAAAALAVNATAGTLTTAPANATVNAGTTATLTAVTAGTGLTYQWRLNGRLLRSVTGATLTIPNVGSTAAGTYEVSVLSADARLAVAPVRLTVNTDARLVNIATRGMVGTEDDEILIAGFVGRGTGNKTVLLRAVGPGLAVAPFNVTGVLANPSITVYRDSTVVATNDNWGTGSAATFNHASAGAALPLTTNDAALLESVPISGITRYTAHVTGPAPRGIALIEVYDADTGTPAVELANISTRAMVGAVNQGELIAGFVIKGTTSDTVLIRGVSQSMGTLHGMRRALGNSHVSVYRSNADGTSTEIAANSVWTKPGRGDPSVADDDDTTFGVENAAGRTGAFPLPRGSQDSALLLTLAPGTYTAVVTGRENNSSGVALVEIYEVR